MYNNFFGFSESPFETTHNPKFLYLNHDYSEVLDSIILGIHEHRGRITVTAEAGTGKTTLIKALLCRLPEKTKATYIYNANLTFKQILIMALSNLGSKRLALDMTDASVLQRFSDFATKQFSDGGNVVIILDEAHNLNGHVLKNLYRISCLESKKRKVFQIILFGKPELDEKLRQAKLTQFTQGLGLRYYIAPLSEKDTCEYIEHRLNIANSKIPSLFSAQALKLIWQLTGGIQRKINLLCDNALLIGYRLGTKRIEKVEINKAAQEMSWSTFGPSHKTQTLSMAKERVAKLSGETVEATQEHITSEFISDTEEREPIIAEEEEADFEAETGEAVQGGDTIDFTADEEEQELIFAQKDDDELAAVAEEAIQDPVEIDFAADEEEQEPIFAEEVEANLGTKFFSDLFIRHAGVVVFFCLIFSVGFLIGNSRFSLNNAISFLVNFF